MWNVLYVDTDWWDWQLLFYLRAHSLSTHTHAQSNGKSHSIQHESNEPHLTKDSLTSWVTCKVTTEWGRQLGSHTVSSWIIGTGHIRSKSRTLKLQTSKTSLYCPGSRTWLKHSPLQNAKPGNHHHHSNPPQFHHCLKWTTPAANVHKLDHCHSNAAFTQNHASTRVPNFLLYSDMADKLLQRTVVTFQGVSTVAAVTVSVCNTH